MNILKSKKSFSILITIMLLFCSIFLAMATIDDDDNDYIRFDFPETFVFGAGTSAYQVEGAAFEDGRKPSIWDTYAHSVEGRENGDRACDQYHKYKEDVKLMAETGLEAYRFSISWSRLIPNGRGTVNPKGLEYYNNLINELVANGIQPHVTLNHVDNPQSLEDEYGGWLSSKIVRDFVEYVNVCFKEFGDRVKYWTTINEPNIFAIGGYDNGLMPPGRCSSPFGFHGRGCSRGNSTTEPYMAAHNMLLAHSSVVKLYRNKYKATQRGFVGINIYAPWFVPKTSAAEDVIATQRALDFYIGWIVHPLVFGDYPESVKKNAGTKIPTIRPSFEKKLIKGSFDFIGLNHYLTFHVQDSPNNLETESRDVNADMGLSIDFQLDGKMDDDDDKTDFSGKGLYNLLDYIKQTYGNPPIYIQENGLPTKHNSTLNDIRRVKFMNAYIGSVLDAIRNGSNTRGYILWSFIDTFELLGGYEMSYGLIYVDFEDKRLKRYPKLSAHCYSNFLKRGRTIWPCGMTELVEENRTGSFPSTTVASR